jgi:hypothetical protein
MSRNSEVLEDFVAYCKAQPDLRFWQALSAWSKVPYILASNTNGIEGTEDTFYWEGRDQ